MLKIISLSSLLILLPSKYSVPTTKTSALMILPLILFYSLPLEKETLSHYFKIDLMSMTLILLTLWISSLMMMASSPTFFYKNRTKWFLFFVLILNLILILAFSSPSTFSFFLFFEASLIPTLFLILGWGYQPERLQAGTYLMMYTMVASLPLLLMIALAAMDCGHSSFIIPQMSNFTFMASPKITAIIFSLAFLVKLPLYLTHLWLPKAHVEAPVAGSMILAGLLLKLGGYGLMRFMVLFKFISVTLSMILPVIAMVGGAVTSMICIRQTDMKSLIAYSSVGHMALLVIGSYSMFLWGWSSALLLMIAHGLSSSALFYLSYTTYLTTQTRSLFLTKGLLNIFPPLILLWFIASAFNMAAPPSINLLSEIMLFSSSYSFTSMSAPILTLISFLAAAYSLILYTTISHGTPPPHLDPMNHYSLTPYLTLLLHLVPATLLILIPQALTLWMYAL